ncbi:hypothetical protein [Stenomitos frigidus]|uniref:Uncharacterized protein n=1 Tax=Stenomitos frigidus ULC18 TaxID=2107698 RepID=A0A2T1ELH1_9CYAN|nr:hypothetical protein [Stenomitos frigidus]PSB33574.1 hypothetical protein C7B82_03540 [Stenomitos frigidus ULC18]
MENLTYLYVLAEESESAPINPKAQQSHSWQSVLPLSNRAEPTQEPVVDNDREHQPYPTFYL